MKVLINSLKGNIDVIYFIEVLMLFSKDNIDVIYFIEFLILFSKFQKQFMLILELKKEVPKCLLSRVICIYFLCILFQYFPKYLHEYVYFSY